MTATFLIILGLIAAFIFWLGVDVAITVANVLDGTNSIIDGAHRFGATVLQGQVCYLDTGNLWQLAKADTLIHAGLAGKVGISLVSGLNGQLGQVQTSGQCTVGGTLVIGNAYYVSKNTAGGIMGVADFATGDWVTPLGIAITTAILQLAPNPTGAQHA